MLERKGDGVIKTLLRQPREPLETSPREPFWDIFYCGNKQFQHIQEEKFVRLGLIRMGKVSTRKAPGTMAILPAFLASSDAT